MKLLDQPPFRADAAPSIALLATITTMGTMALHMVIPVMPAMAADLHASPGVIQMTVTLYLFGLAAGQLIYGPLSDRFGRRPVLLVGLVIYVLSGILVATTANAGLLLAARIFQALGGCSGLVLGRAMMRDGASPDKAARSMAILNTAMSLGPALSPAIGGYVALWGGWRAPFVLLVVLGAAMLLLAVLTLPETNRQRTDFSGIRSMIGSYATLLRLPAYRGYAVTACCASTSMYAFFAASPFIFMGRLNQTAEQVGVYYLIVALGISAGSYLAAHLARRFGLRVLAAGGNAMQFVGAVALLVLVFAGHLTVPSVIVVALLFSLASGFTSPMALAGAVSADARLIGAASGLYGFLQFAYAMLVTGFVGIWPGDAATSVAIVFIGSALLGRWGLAHAGGARPGA